MSDYNFFSEYQKKKKLKINPDSIYFWGGIIVLICILAIIGVFVRNYVLSSQIETITISTVQIKSDADYVKANELQQSLDAMLAYDTQAEISLQKLEQLQVIDSDLISSLMSGVPKNVTVATFGMDNISFGMTCNTPDKKSAAELLLGIRNTDLCSDLQLISVETNTTEGGFTVTLEGTFKEGEAQ